MNIAVLAGGISTEREVSIVSGTGVCKALREKGHRAILIDVFCGDEEESISQIKRKYFRRSMMWMHRQLTCGP